MADGNGWDEYQKLVLSKLDEHGSQFEAMWKELRRIGESVAEIKGRSAATAGVISVVISALGVVIAWSVAIGKP